MDVTPQSLKDVEFRQALRGYDPDEVDLYLQRVSAGVAQLQGRLSEAISRAEAAEARIDRGETAVSSKPKRSGDQPSEETITRTLLLAQQTADQLLTEARDEASATLSQVQNEAAEVRGAAQAEADELRRVAKLETDELRSTTISETDDLRSSAESDTTKLRRTTQSEVDALLMEAEHASSKAAVEAEAERNAILSEVESEARAVAEETRKPLLAEIRELENRRDFLAEDTALLEHHVEAERSNLREAIARLETAVDAPEALRVSEVPTLSRYSKLEPHPDEGEHSDDVVVEDTSIADVAETPASEERVDAVIIDEADELEEADEVEELEESEDAKPADLVNDPEDVDASALSDENTVAESQLDLTDGAGGSSEGLDDLDSPSKGAALQDDVLESDVLESDVLENDVLESDAPKGDAEAVEVTEIDLSEDVESDTMLTDVAGEADEPTTTLPGDSGDGGPSGFGAGKAAAGAAGGVAVASSGSFIDRFGAASTTESATDSDVLESVIVDDELAAEDQEVTDAEVENASGSARDVHDFERTPIADDLGFVEPEADDDAGTAEEDVLPVFDDDDFFSDDAAVTVTGDSNLAGDTDQLDEIDLRSDTSTGSSLASGASTDEPTQAFSVDGNTPQADSAFSDSAFSDSAFSDSAFSDGASSDSAFSDGEVTDEPTGDAFLEELRRAVSDDDTTDDDDPALVAFFDDESDGPTKRFGRQR